MRFYLGTHRPNWLGKTDVDLFVSNRTLKDRHNFPRALGQWALDSGGFSELSMFGRWETSPEQYVTDVRVYRDEIGGLQWAAPQDWMCEPQMVAKTALSVIQHQERTVANFVHLRSIAPDLPFIPVLQGWTLSDYEWCMELYTRAGVNLWKEPLIGLGSVCRRQATGEIDVIVERLGNYGLNLHGFGVKFAGLRLYGGIMRSSDSMAWSFRARRSEPLTGCTHKNCANCLRYALKWRATIMRSLETTQMRMAQEVLGIDYTVPATTPIYDPRTGREQAV